jgi:hypothetical protein
MVIRMKRVGVAGQEDVDRGLELFRDVVSDCCRAVEGFRGAYFLVDSSERRTVTLTLWTDADALSEARHNLLERLRNDHDAAAMVERVNSGGVEFETYEVAARI